MDTTRRHADAVDVISATGLDAATVAAWLDAAHTPFAGSRRVPRFDADAGRAGRAIAQGWEMLARLPLRSRRSERERAGGDAIRETIADVCTRFCRVHVRDLYLDLTHGLTHALRVDDLLWQAAERWPGLLPARAELAAESERMQMDKDGRELLQGIVASHVLGDPELGTHLIASMLRPTAEAVERLPELTAAGRLDLGAARVEIAGEIGHVWLRNPRYLNAEDDQTVGPQEVAVDLLLLYPGVRLGVLRGDRVEHAKYAGRRIFSAGINLTKIYYGRLSYLFYLVRDLGLVHKLYRGLHVEDQPANEPERTQEKPWIAVVDGFAIGGGCQLLLVVDYVLADTEAYLSLPARKEGIIPGAANLRLPRFLGERLAREAIMFDRMFRVTDPEARGLVNEVHPSEALDAAVETVATGASGSGMVSAAGNRRALRVQTEPLDVFRQYMATYAREQAFCHLSDQLVANLERHWRARDRRLAE